jgi:hypothetical protein
MKTPLQNRVGFTLSLIFLILVVFNLFAEAQENKQLKKKVIIKNGDTTVNGKKISEFNLTERDKLRKDLHALERSHAIKKEIIIERNIPGGKNDIADKDALLEREETIPGLDERDITIKEFRFSNPEMQKRVFRFNVDSMALITKDSLIIRLRNRVDRPFLFEDRVIARDGEMEPGNHFLFKSGSNNVLIDRDIRKSIRLSENSQMLHFNNIDKDGIATRISFRISKVEKNVLLKLIKSDNASELTDVLDVTLYPNFSSGNTTLALTIPKGITSIKVLDTDLDIILSEKTNNVNFSKQMTLPVNGIYYLVITQNNKWFVRQIVKE